MTRQRTVSACQAGLEKHFNAPGRTARLSNGTSSDRAATRIFPAAAPFCTDLRTQAEVKRSVGKKLGRRRQAGKRMPVDSELLKDGVNRPEITFMNKVCQPGGPGRIRVSELEEPRRIVARIQLRSDVPVARADTRGHVIGKASLQAAEELRPFTRHAREAAARTCVEGKASLASPRLLELPAVPRH